MAATKQQHCENLWIVGFDGRMGQELQALCATEPSNSWRLLGGTSSERGWKEFSAQRGQIHHIVDFSSNAGNLDLLKQLQKEAGACRSVLIGTTGLDAERLAAWQALAVDKNLAVLQAPNTSLGIALTLRAALAIVRSCYNNNFDVELNETHHRYKKDAPSGTALYLAEQLSHALAQTTVVTDRKGERQRQEIGIQASRGGGVVGEHTLRFLGDDEEILIQHRAFSRKVFARGALVLSSWVRQQKSGFYTLADVGL